MEEVCQIVGFAPSPGALSWPPLALIGAAIMWKRVKTLVALI